MTDVNPEVPEAPVQDHLLSNKTYDVLQQLVRVVLPALAALYIGLAAIWDWPKSEEVAGTLAAIATFLGVFLNLSKKSYVNSDSRFDGIINVEQDPNTGMKHADLILKNYENPADVVNQREVSFKVLPPGTSPQQ